MDDWRSKAEKLYAETSDIAAFMRRLTLFSGMYMAWI